MRASFAIENCRHSRGAKRFEYRPRSRQFKSFILVTRQLASPRIEELHHSSASCDLRLQISDRSLRDPTQQISQQIRLLAHKLLGPRNVPTRLPLNHVTS